MKITRVERMDRRLARLYEMFAGFSDKVLKMRRRRFLATFEALTGDTTLGIDDEYVTVTGTTTITLPASQVGNSRKFYIKNIGTAAVTIQDVGAATIDGELTLEIIFQYDSVTLLSDGEGWHIV